MNCWNPMHDPPVRAIGWAWVEDDSLRLPVCPSCYSVAAQEDAGLRIFKRR